MDLLEDAEPALARAAVAQSGRAGVPVHARRRQGRASGSSRRPSSCSSRWSRSRPDDPAAPVRARLRPLHAGAPGGSGRPPPESVRLQPDQVASPTTWRSWRAGSGPRRRGHRAAAGRCSQRHPDHAASCEALGGLLMGAQTLRRGRGPSCERRSAEPEVGEGQLPARPAARRARAGRRRPTSSSRWRSRFAKDDEDHSRLQLRLLEPAMRPREPLAGTPLCRRRTSRSRRQPRLWRSRRRSSLSVSQLEADGRSATRPTPTLHVALGLAYWRQNDYPRALDAFQRAVKVGPRVAEAHNWLGVALSEKADLPGAIAELQEGRRARSEVRPRLHEPGRRAGHERRLHRGRRRCSARRWRSSPNSLAAHINLGTRAARERRPGRRARHLRRVAAAIRQRRRFSTSSARRSARAATSPAPFGPFERRSSSTPSCAKATTRWARR